MALESGFIEDIDLESIDNKLISFLNNHAKLSEFSVEDELDLSGDEIIYLLSQYLNFEEVFNEKNYLNYASLGPVLSLPAPNVQILKNARVFSDCYMDCTGNTSWYYENVKFVNNKVEFVFL